MGEPGKGKFNYLKTSFVGTGTATPNTQKCQ